MKFHQSFSNDHCFQKLREEDSGKIEMVMSQESPKTIRKDSGEKVGSGKLQSVLIDISFALSIMEMVTLVYVYNMTMIIPQDPPEMSRIVSSGTVRSGTHSNQNEISVELKDLDEKQVSFSNLC